MSGQHGTAEISKKFDSVLNLRADIDSILEMLDTRLSIIRNIYTSMAKKYGSNPIYSMGIDSFHFQSALIEADGKHLKKVYREIDNRIYGEYYNLYHMILEYIGNELGNKRLVTKLSKDFPPYKTLVDTSYSITVTAEIQALVSEAILELESLIVSKESELEGDKKHSKMGLNIDSLVHMHSFANSMIRARTGMFREHLEAFFAHHTRYYTRLLTRAKLHMGIVNDDINVQQFRETGSTNLDRLRADLSTASPSNSAFSKLTESDPPQVTEVNPSPRSVDAKTTHSASPINRGISDYAGLSAAEQEEPPTVSLQIKDPSLLEEETGPNIPEESEVGAGEPATDARDLSGKIGSQVGVIGYEGIGTLRFYGERAGGGGLRCGVEFEEPVGRNNGMVAGHEYFKCADRHGVLVVPGKVILMDDAISEGEEGSSNVSVSPKPSEEDDNTVMT